MVFALPGFVLVPTTLLLNMLILYLHIFKSDFLTLTLINQLLILDNILNFVKKKFFIVYLLHETVVITFPSVNASYFCPV